MSTPTPRVRETFGTVVIVPSGTTRRMRSFTVSAM